MQISPEKYTSNHEAASRNDGCLRLVAPTEPNRGPLVAVATCATLRGLVTVDDGLNGRGRDGEPVKPLLVVCDLADLFEQDETSDAHVVTYVVTKNGEPVEHQPRLNKEVLPALRAQGFEVLCHSVFIDVDLKDMVGRKPKVKWTDLSPAETENVWNVVELAHAHLAAKGMAWTAYYTTQSGLRFVHALALPVPAGDGYEALLARFHAAYKIAGLPADGSCKDWTRLYRAPRVTKEDGTETWAAPWYSETHDFDDDTTYYAPSDDDLVPPEATTVVPVVRVDRARPAPEQARELVETLNNKGEWVMTDAGRAAKNALRDSAAFDIIYNRLPIGREGKRHAMLTKVVGTVVDTLHGLHDMTPEMVYALLYDAAGRLGEDEDWLGKVWEMATTFWDRDTAKKAQQTPTGPTIPADPGTLPEPSGMNAAEWLAFFNSRHAIVRDFGGKCRVIGWRNEHGRDVLYHQSFEDVRKGYSNRRVRISTVKDGEDQAAVKYHEAGKWWLEQRDRRQFERVVYAPGREREFDGCLNLWKGWGVEPAAGDWSLMQRHVLEVLAAGDQQHADYILRWAAWAVQNPGRVAEVALVFRGGEGTGKGTFARAMKDLFGQHGVHVTSGPELTGRFNSHMRDCSLLFADEAVAPEDRDAVGRLKAMVTEPTIRVEPKGVDSQEVPNCLHVIMASNERWVVPAGEGDRRFVVFDVSEARKEDRAWFDPLFAQLQAGGLAAMLHDLLAMDIRGWHPRQGRPKTVAHAEQKAQSLQGVDRLWFDCLNAGELPVGALLADGSVRVRTRDLLDAFTSRTSSPNVNRTSLGMLLFGSMRFEDGREAQGGKATFVVVPALAQARQRWAEKRFPFPWPPADGWSAAR